jgi:hypothetical protein
MKNGTDAAPARHPELKSSYKKCRMTHAGERRRIAGGAVFMFTKTRLNYVPFFKFC